MNWQNFLAQLNRKNILKAPEEKLSAAAFFEKEAGKEVMRFISDNATVINERTFKIVDVGFVQRLHAHPLYKGRDFFQDMKDLHFSIEIESRKIDDIEVNTYTFKH